MGPGLPRPAAGRRAPERALDPERGSGHRRLSDELPGPLLRLQHHRPQPHLHDQRGRPRPSGPRLLRADAAEPPGLLPRHPSRPLRSGAQHGPGAHRRGRDGHHPDPHRPGGGDRAASHRVHPLRDERHLRVPGVPGISGPARTLRLLLPHPHLAVQRDRDPGRSLPSLGDLRQRDGLPRRKPRREASHHPLSDHLVDARLPLRLRAPDGLLRRGGPLGEPDGTAAGPELLHDRPLSERVEPLVVPGACRLRGGLPGGAPGLRPPQVRSEEGQGLRKPASERRGAHPFELRSRSVRSRAP